VSATNPRTRLDPDERREQILKAAIAAFRASDYSTVSLDAVAESSGVTRGLLHHYFGSKRSLYLAALERSIRIPPTMRLVPADTAGPLDALLASCVAGWLDLVEAVGPSIWHGVISSIGVGDSDVGAILMSARDELVERMIDELPLSADLDREMLRGALRSYAAFALVAIDEWQSRSTLGRSQVQTMLTATLVALVNVVVPEMSA
jgi:AcrR family transcriptional regulator